MKTNQLKKQKGFTLIELMIVVGIIGVLSAIAVPAYQSYLLKTEANTAVSIPRTLLTNIDLFIQEKGEFPSDSNFSEIGGAKNMSALGSLTLTKTEKTKGTLIFKIESDSALKDKTVTFTRNENGWKCTHTTEQKLKGCSDPTAKPAT
ncbi:prepilin-type N-terminal cleavage/methylation domain-containing protein [Vibrio plantisponsor]|uniref:Prepilin-type N-terminal cleavage/methylation domain-containing protein n=1 Tax=Vibrio plantisponsor TaxID=664643 RepID=A0ABU4IK21_9VIBR|nr:prepilin-type N-terminal cleavage/methylation domain-containing protein [Vibrio plantisponsor]MDW6018890.1 prepilin-type N-terminal cleavage/methylation domain-containing protein [Vibrio plantisponsor]NNM41277.1 prepilin-type N-terminal cleavage/methylation domain-containing protein [Vibrio plantisponsor]